MLVDIAGRVDPGVGTAISAVIAQLDQTYDSVESYLASTKGLGLIEPWNDYWDRAYRYGLTRIGDRFRVLVHPHAVTEDRAYTDTQDPYDRWRYLDDADFFSFEQHRSFAQALDTSSLRMDRDLFVRTVIGSTVAEIDANHLTINTQRGHCRGDTGILGALERQMGCVDSKVPRGRDSVVRRRSWGRSRTSPVVRLHPGHGAVATTRTPRSPAPVHDSFQPRTSIRVRSRGE